MTDFIDPYTPSAQVYHFPNCPLNGADNKPAKYPDVKVEGGGKDEDGDAKPSKSNVAFIQKNKDGFLHLNETTWPKVTDKVYAWRFPISLNGSIQSYSVPIPFLGAIASDGVRQIEKYGSDGALSACKINRLPPSDTRYGAGKRTAEPMLFASGFTVSALMYALASLKIENLPVLAKRFASAIANVSTEAKKAPASEMSVAEFSDLVAAGKAVVLTAQDNPTRAFLYTPGLQAILREAIKMAGGSPDDIIISISGGEGEADEPGRGPLPKDLNSSDLRAEQEVGGMRAIGIRVDPFRKLLKASEGRKVIQEFKAALVELERQDRANQSEAFPNPLNTLYLTSHIDALGRLFDQHFPEDKPTDIREAVVQLLKKEDESVTANFHSMDGKLDKGNKTEFAKLEALVPEKKDADDQLYVSIGAVSKPLFAYAVAKGMPTRTADGQPIFYRRGVSDETITLFVNRKEIARIKMDLEQYIGDVDGKLPPKDPKTNWDPPDRVNKLNPLRQTLIQIKSEVEQAPDVVGELRKLVMDEIVAHLPKARREAFQGTLDRLRNKEIIERRAPGTSKEWFEVAQRQVPIELIAYFAFRLGDEAATKYLRITSDAEKGESVKFAVRVENDIGALSYYLPFPAALKVAGLTDWLVMDDDDRVAVRVQSLLSQVTGKLKTGTKFEVIRQKLAEIQNDFDKGLGNIKTARGAEEGRIGQRYSPLLTVLGGGAVAAVIAKGKTLLALAGRLATAARSSLHRPICAGGGLAGSVMVGVGGNYAKVSLFDDPETADQLSVQLDDLRFELESAQETVAALQTEIEQLETSKQTVPQEKRTVLETTQARVRELQQTVEEKESEEANVTGWRHWGKMIGGVALAGLGIGTMRYVCADGRQPAGTNPQPADASPAPVDDATPTPDAPDNAREFDRTKAVVDEALNKARSMVTDGHGTDLDRSDVKDKARALFLKHSELGRLAGQAAANGGTLPDAEQARFDQLAQEIHAEGTALSQKAGGITFRATNPGGFVRIPIRRISTAVPPKLAEGVKGPVVDTKVTAFAPVAAESKGGEDKGKTLADGRPKDATHDGAHGPIDVRAVRK